MACKNTLFYCKIKIVLQNRDTVKGMDVYISGVGMTKFGKSKDPLELMMAEAAGLALKDAGLERVDGIYIGVMNVEEFVGDSNFAALLADTLGLTGIPSTRVETASSTGAGAFETAFYAVASGHMKHVLVLAGEKMTHLPTTQTTRILSEAIDRSERRYGATLPALAAMVAQKYAQAYGLPLRRLEDILAQVAIKNHLNGVQNPHAQFRAHHEERLLEKSNDLLSSAALRLCAYHGRGSRHHSHLSTGADQGLWHRPCHGHLCRKPPHLADLLSIHKGGCS
jgi:acetyl-CoA acetyltransferase